VVTAGSVVQNSVPPKTIVRGNPAQPIAKTDITFADKSILTEEIKKHIYPI